MVACGADFERAQILAQNIEGVRIALNENRARGATAKSFDADCASAREGIHEQRAFDARREHVEQRFTKTVGVGRTARPGKDFRIRRRNSPAITRMPTSLPG